MENEISKPLASEIANSAVSSGLRTAGIMLGGSALVGISSHIALPLWFTPVPLTLQPFAVLLLGLLLGPRLAAATLGAYLLEGAAGLPVFAPGFALGRDCAPLRADRRIPDVVPGGGGAGLHGFGDAPSADSRGNAERGGRRCAHSALRSLLLAGALDPMQSIASAFALAVFPSCPATRLRS